MGDSVSAKEGLIYALGKKDGSETEEKFLAFEQLVRDWLAFLEANPKINDQFERFRYGCHRASLQVVPKR